MTAVDILCHLLYTGILCILLVSIRFLPVRLLVLVCGLRGLSSVLSFSREVSAMLHALFTAGVNFIFYAVLFAFILSLVRSCFR